MAMQSKRHLVSLSLDSASPAVVGRFPFLSFLLWTPFPPLFLFSFFISDSFRMLHSEILGLYLRSFKKPATNPVALMLSVEQGDFCLPLSQEKADLGGAEPKQQMTRSPFLSLGCSLRGAPAGREPGPGWVEGCLCSTRRAGHCFLPCWDLIGCSA